MKLVLKVFKKYLEEYFNFLIYEKVGLVRLVKQVIKLT